MIRVTVREGGHIALPDGVRARYGLTPGTLIRLVETRDGLLLVPLTDETMSEELARELKEWQAASLHCWNRFPYANHGIGDTG